MQNPINKFLSSIIYTMKKGKAQMFINLCVDKNMEYSHNGIFFQPLKKE